MGTISVAEKKNKIIGEMTENAQGFVDKVK